MGSSGQSVVVAINKRLCHICDRTPSAYKQVIFKHNTFARERQRSLRLAYLDDVSLVVATVCRLGTRPHIIISIDIYARNF